jgi:hypothetical protein
MSDYKKDDSTPLRTKSLVEHVEESRAERLKEREAKDLTNINLWVTEAGFISPYPDRVRILTADATGDLLRVLADLANGEFIPGTILSIQEEHLTMVINIAEHLEWVLGYVSNPDTEYDGWSFWTRSVKTIDSLDIGSLFEPLHLPDSSELKEIETTEVEGDIEDEISH